MLYGTLGVEQGSESDVPASRTSVDPKKARTVFAFRLHVLRCGCFTRFVAQDGSMEVVRARGKRDGPTPGSVTVRSFFFFVDSTKTGPVFAFRLHVLRCGCRTQLVAQDGSTKVARSSPGHRWFLLMSCLYLVRFGFVCVGTALSCAFLFYSIDQSSKLGHA